MDHLNIKNLSKSAQDVFLSGKLKKFIQIYEARNIRKAAEQLRISQPPLTIALKQLEEALGQTLFTRSAHGVTPTPQGELLYRYASSMRQTAKLAFETLSQEPKGTNYRLRIGAGVAWTSAILPQVLSDLRSNHANLTFDMIEGVSDQLAASFTKGDIDLFIAASPMNDRELTDVTRQNMGNLKMFAVADRHSIIAQKKNVTIADLIETEWAGFLEDEIFVHLASHYMQVQGLNLPQIAMRTNSVTALLAYISGSEMVSMLASPLAEVAQNNGLVKLPMEQELWEVPMYVFVRNALLDLPITKSFVALIERHVQEFYDM